MTKIRFQYSTNNNDVYFFSFLNDKFNEFLPALNRYTYQVYCINQYMHQLESLTSLHEGEKASNNFPKHLHLFYAELINYLS